MILLSQALRTNSRFYNAVAWIYVVLLTGLTLALVAINLRDLWGR